MVIYVLHLFWGNISVSSVPSVANVFWLRLCRPVSSVVEF